jgi:hypothetical protein
MSRAGIMGDHPRPTAKDDLMIWLVLLGFLAVVVTLAALNSRRTRGRSCCAPADPAADLRMRDR